MVFKSPTFGPAASKVGDGAILLTPTGGSGPTFKMTATAAAPLATQFNFSSSPQIIRAAGSGDRTFGEPPVKKSRKVVLTDDQIVCFDRTKYEYLSDATIKSKTKEFKVHKFKLAWNSTIFEKMFQDKDSNNNKAIILMEHRADDTVEDFVKFLYAGELEDPKRFTTDLLALGHKFEVKVITEECSEHLETNITKENVAKILKVAKDCDQPKLVQAVYAFLQINWAAKDECKGLVEVMKNHPDIAIDLCTFFQKNSFPGFVAAIGKK